jgi:actin-related protein 3
MVSGSKLQYGQLDYYIGAEAFKHARSHTISYPIRSGMIENWEHIEKFWHRSIYQYLKCEPENHNFILVLQNLQNTHSFKPNSLNQSK